MGDHDAETSVGDAYTHDVDDDGDIEFSKAAATALGLSAPTETYWFQRRKHTKRIGFAVAVSALVNLTLCTIVAFIGVGWDWDIALAEMMMQVCNGGIAATLHYRKTLLNRPRAPTAVLLLLLANLVLRMVVYIQLIEIVTSEVNSNDGECKVLAPDGTCLTFWYIYTKEVQQFAAISLVTMSLDTILMVGSTLNLRAILRIEKFSDALAKMAREQSDTSLLANDK